MKVISADEVLKIVGFHFVTNQMTEAAYKDINSMIKDKSIDDEIMKLETESTCKWTKGMHSYETCWSDVSIKDFNTYAMVYCPHCGKKIEIVGK